MMCRHEIVLHNKFHFSKFDIMYHHRANVTMSYKMGPSINYNNDATTTSDVLNTIDESIEGCTIDGINFTCSNKDYYSINDNGKIIHGTHE